MKIEFANYQFKIKEENSKRYIFDIIRKKYVALTPEEWVRQNCIHYLINEKKFPKSLLAVEKNIVVNRMQKRCDIVAFDRNGKQFLIVECKSPQVAITQDVFDQIARYNLSLQVKYLMVTNGKEHFGCEMDYEKQSYRFIEELPLYHLE